MTRNILETTDIFIGAFLLCMGGCLCGIRIKDHVKGIAAFRIEGEGLDRCEREYRTGRALVNPVLLRESLNLLRDILFEFQEGSARYDRKRSHRGGQAKR
jgi:hypothetical protein